MEKEIHDCMGVVLPAFHGEITVEVAEPPTYECVIQVPPATSESNPFPISLIDIVTATGAPSHSKISEESVSGNISGTTFVSALPIGFQKRLSKRECFGHHPIHVRDW